MSRLALLLVLALASACSRARAEQPSAADRTAARAAALDAREARLKGDDSGTKPVDDAACPDDLVAWQRGKELALCAQPCTSDKECSSLERCRVLFFDGMERGPTKEAVFADDVPEVFTEYAETESLTADGMLQDDPPECDAECRPYSGDLTIRAVKPVALCDPFHDVEGALLSAEDEEALAAEETASGQD